MFALLLSRRVPRVAGTRRDAGVSIAEVNLKLIWDVVSQIKVGEKGSAYVIDREGRIVAQWTGIPANGKELESRLEQLLRTD